MKKKTLEQHISLHITALCHDGRGIAHLNGKVTFIPGALPGENVVVQLTRQHRRYNEGLVIEILQPAKERVTPPCAHFGVCGGCSLQHLDMQAQLNFKQDTLLTQLRHFGHVTPTEILPPIHGSSSLGYRRKARLGVRYVVKKNRILVGFREHSSHYLACIDSCKTLHPRVGENIAALSDFIHTLEAFARIPQIEVAVGDHATALVFRHHDFLSEQDQEKLCRFAAAYQFEIYLQPDAPQPVHKLYPRDGNERLSYFLDDFHLEMRFHPLDFTQINHEINQKMLQQAMTLLDPQPQDRILDLFCGLGNFTLPLAQRAAHVVGVEGNPAMVERGYENAAHNKITNVEFHAANLANPLLTPPWANQPFNKILLDPPRCGAKEILALLAQIQAQRIVYVSCNPATLARDAGELTERHGYQLTKLGIINMFPHTSHVEAMALFERVHG